MSLAYPRLSSGRAVLALDAALLAWVIVWIVLAILIARDVRNLSQLSTTVVTAGVAIDETGKALATLGSIPFAGGQIAQVSQRIRSAGKSAEVSGRQSRESVTELSVLLGIAIGLIPSIPLLGLYAPLRIGRIREVRAIRRAFAQSGGDPAFLEFLARRAAENLPYHRLREVTPNPWRDLEEGRYEALAAAELGRLGLRPRPAARA
ncbi:MAG: hypothetical protein E6G67_08995 [Actinobacteria bacterium]|nr:MAG: hypothetical protein E6G67_08995 [Actinomycetota bacterium]